MKSSSDTYRQNVSGNSDRPSEQEQADNMNKPRIRKTIIYGLSYLTIKWIVIFLVGGAIYKSGYWSNWYLIAIPIIGIFIILLRKRIGTYKNMHNYKKYFTQSIKQNFPTEFDEIITDTDYNYRNISADTKFASTSPNPLDKRLDFSAYFLALIKSLDKKGKDFDTIRKVCIEIVSEYVRPKNKIQQFLKRLPAKLMNTWLANIIVKLLNKKISQNSHPDGFVANIITDKKETYGLGYGIDILECGICKLFAKNNYDKYSSILCEVDAITSDLAGLKLIRTGTIANGAKKCDFRFKTKN